MSKLKPKARFRARAYVLIFIHRTRKVIAEKKVQDEKDNAEFENQIQNSPDSIDVSNPAIVQLRKPSLDIEQVDNLPGQISPPREISPRVEERKAQDNKSKREEVEIVRSNLRNRRNSNAGVGLPIMVVGDVLDNKKRHVEEKIKEGAKAAAQKIDHVGKKVANNMGKVRIAPTGGENSAGSPNKENGDIELGDNHVYVLPKESQQADHEMNLKTPPKSDASLV